MVMAVLLLVAMLIASFCAGIAFLVFGKAILRADKQNILIRCAAFLYRKAGYLACFGAGAFLSVIIELDNSPYYVFAWSSAYDDWLLGSAINDEPKIMRTGQIPQELLDWYAENRIR